MTETTPEGIVNPPIDQLLEHVDSKYRLRGLAATRARQTHAYSSQLAERRRAKVGPLVETTNQEKPLSIAMREIQAGVVEAHEMDAEEIAAQAAAAQEAPAIELDDPFADLADPNA